MKTLGVLLLLTLMTSTLVPGTASAAQPDLPKNVPWYGISELAKVSVWNVSLERSRPWNFNVHRIAFQWDDLNLYDTLDEILHLMDGYGAKAVLDYHPIDDHALVKLGSTQLKANWAGLVTRFKDDPRVIAWEIFNEPFDWGLDPTLLQAADRDLAIMKAQAELTDVIRGIDPVRPVVWSLNYHNKNVPMEYRRENIVLTGHLYSYGSKDNWTQLKELADYLLASFERYQTQFAKLWLGEFAWHETSAGGAETVSLEMRYDVYIMNYTISHGWGFSYWSYSKNHYAPPEASADKIIAATNYKPPASPPIPTNNEDAGAEPSSGSSYNAFYILSIAAIVLASSIFALFVRARKQKSWHTRLKARLEAMMGLDPFRLYRSSRSFSRGSSSPLTHHRP